MATEAEKTCGKCSRPIYGNHWIQPSPSDDKWEHQDCTNPTEPTIKCVNYREKAAEEHDAYDRDVIDWALMKQLPKCDRARTWTYYPGYRQCSEVMIGDLWTESERAILQARAADPVIPYPPEKSEERLKAFRVIDDPCDPEHLERLAQTMTPKQRQAFYEHLYKFHRCRIFNL